MTFSRFLGTHLLCEVLVGEGGDREAG